MVGMSFGQSTNVSIISEYVIFFLFRLNVQEKKNLFLFLWNYLFL